MFIYSQHFDLFICRFMSRILLEITSLRLFDGLDGEKMVLYLSNLHYASDPTDLRFWESMLICRKELVADIFFLSFYFVVK